MEVEAIQYQFAQNGEGKPCLRGREVVLMVQLAPGALANDGEVVRRAADFVGFCLDIGPCRNMLVVDDAGRS